MASIVRPEPASGSAQAASDGATVSSASFSGKVLVAGDDAALTAGDVAAAGGTPASSIAFSGKVLVARDAALTAGDVAAGGDTIVAVGGATSATAGGGDAAAALALNGLAAFRGRLR